VNKENKLLIKELFTDDLKRYHREAKNHFGTFHATNAISESHYNTNETLTDERPYLTVYLIFPARIVTNILYYSAYAPGLVIDGMLAIFGKNQRSIRAFRKLLGGESTVVGDKVFSELKDFIKDIKLNIN
jgi:hypothetical protein